MSQIYYIRLEKSKSTTSNRVFPFFVPTQLQTDEFFWKFYRFKTASTSVKVYVAPYVVAKIERQKIYQSHMNFNTQMIANILTILATIKAF